MHIFTVRTNSDHIFETSLVELATVYTFRAVIRCITALYIVAFAQRETDQFWSDCILSTYDDYYKP